MHGRSRSFGTIALWRRSGMYAACERKPVVATIAIRTSRIDPSADVSHGPRRGERQKPGRNGPGGAGGMAASPLEASKRYEGAARERTGLGDVEARAPCDVRDAVHADP